MTIAYEPISLGSACETKFQTCRKLYYSFYGLKSEAGFRMQMLPPERGKAQFGWNVFDWHRLPFPALLTFLERDFDGVLDRSDLYIDGNLIMNRALQTEHSHQFPPHSPAWTDAHIDATFPLVQSSQAKRADRFREMLTLPGPYLYVWTATSDYAGTDRLPSADEVRHLLDMLSAGSRGHQFHLLMVGNEGKDADYSGLEGKVTKAWRAQDSGKPVNMAWEGNDRAWEAILEPFALTLHQSKPETEPVVKAGASAGRGGASLLSRLLGR